MLNQNRKRLNSGARQWYCWMGGEGDGGGSDSGVVVDGGASPEVSGSAPVNEGTELPGWSEPVASKSKSEPTDFGKLIPDAYKDKPYLKGIDSVDKLLEQFDNAQTLIGKKTVGTLAEDATDEETQQYYEKLRPKEAKEYEFPEIELPKGKEKLQELLKATRSDELDSAIKQVFHDAGLTKKQASMVYNRFNTEFLNHNEKIYAEAQAEYEKQNIDFDALAKQTWGKDTDKVLANAKTLLTEHTPKAFKDHLATLPNEYAIIMASTLESIRQKYMKEDGGNLQASGGQTPSLESLREKGRILMAHEAFTNSTHPQHEEYVRLVRENYAPLKQQKR